MSASDIAATVGAALGGALVGAYFGAWFQNRTGIRNQERRIHRANIKKKCLRPLSKCLKNFWHDELFINDSQTAYDPNVADRSIVDRLAESFEKYPRVDIMLRGLETIPDQTLYEDLKNHYNFKNDLDKLDAGLDGKFAEYRIVKLRLYSGIYQLLNASPLPKEGDQPKWDAICLFYYSMEEPPANWPNAFLRTKDAMEYFDKSKEKHELRELGTQFRKLHDALNETTNHLLQEVNVALNSQRRLTGSCQFLD